MTEAVIVGGAVKRRSRLCSVMALPSPTGGQRNAAQDALSLTLGRSDSTMITASISLEGKEDSQDVEAVTARLGMVRHGGAR
jgi:hypothetical protein